MATRKIEVNADRRTITIGGCSMLVEGLTDEQLQGVCDIVRIAYELGKADGALEGVDVVSNIAESVIKSFRR